MTLLEFLPVLGMAAWLALVAARLSIRLAARITYAGPGRCVHGQSLDDGCYHCGIYSPDELDELDVPDRPIRYASPWFPVDGSSH